MNKATPTHLNRKIKNWLLYFGLILVSISWLSCETVPKSPEGFWLNEQENDFLYFTEDSLFTKWRRRSYTKSGDTVLTDTVFFENYWDPQPEKQIFEYPIKYLFIENSKEFKLHQMRSADTVVYLKSSSNTLFQHQMKEKGLLLNLTTSSVGYTLPPKRPYCYKLHIGFKGDSLVTLMNGRPWLNQIARAEKGYTYFPTNLIEIMVDEDVIFDDVFSICNQIDSVYQMRLGQYHAVSKEVSRAEAYGYWRYPWNNKAYIPIRLPISKDLLESSFIGDLHVISIGMDGDSLILGGKAVPKEKIKELIAFEYESQVPDVGFEIIKSKKLTYGQFISLWIKILEVVDEAREEYVIRKYKKKYRYSDEGRPYLADSILNELKESLPRIIWLSSE